MKKHITEIIDVIKKYNRFVITTHQIPDGDGLGCETAFLNLLKQMGKQVYVINEKSLPEKYQFLPGADEIDTLKIFKKKNFVPEVSIVFDCSGAERMGSVSHIILKTPIVINIDHHIENENFGTINWVSPQQSSVGMMCYFLISQMEKMNKEISECLYTSLSFDTGSFHYNLTDKTFYVAAELLKYGINPQDIANKIYYQQPLKITKLLALILKTIKIDQGLKIIWAKVSLDMYKKTKTTEEDTEGLIDILRSVKEAEMAFLMKERKKEIKISIRSKSMYNTHKIAKHFGGGGHPNASGFSIYNASLKKSEDIILQFIREKWKDLLI
ncbi:MAG: bifunctional oligoribonuclease/PAP phosphatase NrnA [Candidatus Omnitrophica bacterium]|jgi:phosphoesterase RecJ-like protein|nr:bifunctional oligoribonuclease/PAP phosphatase NrnA [Candidatus Omnitrophota bacterium]